MRVTVSGKHATVSGDGKHVSLEMVCPGCGETPVRAVGGGITARTRDTYLAQASSLCCGASLGEMRTQMETLFGLEEDEAVLSFGRARVYGGGKRA